MSMSLDGLVAAVDDGPGRGLGDGGEPLHAWLTAGSTDPDASTPEHGVNAQVIAELLSSGAVIAGRHTYEWGGWGGDHHDGVPIFVLTRNPPAQPVQGNVHYTSDPASAVVQAKAAAGDRDVMVHGASSVQELVRLGLVDEFATALVPLVLNDGRRLFENLPAGTRGLRLVRTLAGEGVLHLRHAVER